MLTGRAAFTLVALCTAILLIGSMHVGQSIFAPVAFAAFTIAIIWPVQRTLQARMPKLLALAITMLVTVVAIAATASIVIWGVARAGQWLVANSARFQTLYLQTSEWLEAHGLYQAGLLAEQFNVSWLIRVFQDLTGRLRNIIAFTVVTLVFVMLGLLEVDEARGKLATLAGSSGQTILRASAETATKLQHYMLVRSLMSLLTGLFVSGFSYAVGLDLALEWGLIAFALNYIPFIGPLIATVLPTLFSIAQFGSLEMGLVVFLGLNLIQFSLGSYVEPRMAGATLSVSPFMVLFAVFFWSFVWGIAGAFIGVPILIAFATFCGHYPSTRWLAHLLGNGERESSISKL
jgi:AI-2 transport protein TqsA